MTSEQFLFLISVVAFLAGASAILKVRTMQNTIDRQGELIEVTEHDLAYNKSKRIELEKTVQQQQQQIDVLTNTVNSSELISALDAHLAEHHREAMGKLEQQHQDMLRLRVAVVDLLEKADSG